MPEGLATFVSEIGFGSRIRRVGAGKAQVPILTDLQCAGAKGGAVSRGKFVDAAEHRFGIRNPEEGQILMQGVKIEFGIKLGHMEQGLHFRSKRELSTAVTVIEVLHSKMIARQK